MTGQGGEWTVNSHLFCFCTFNWAFGNGIINMQLQSPRECAGEVRPCVRVCACVSHYSFVSPEWVVAIQALCVQSERRREAHLHMRSQIIHLTLRQEGSTERRRAKLKESEEKKGKKRGNQRGRWWEKNKQQSEWCELQRGKRKRLALKGNSDEKECVCESERARWSEKENEGETAAECYCAFLIRPAERFYCPQLYNEQLRV